MLNIFLGVPNPKQDLFLRDTHRYVCYGGAKGGGKSHVLRVKAIVLATNYGGIKILVIRRTYTELYHNHIIPMMRLLTGVAKYSSEHKSFEFPNGSTIVFGYCDCGSDAVRYQGQEYDILMIDEATTLMEEWFNDLKLCVRGVNGLPKRTYLTCNPGGVGHDYIKRLFIDRDNYRPGENKNDYSFIQALVYDNTELINTQPEYVQNLEALPPDRRAALLYGDWNAFEGRFFPEFKRETHVIEPFPIPDHWRRYRSIDYGLDMLACLWIAVSDTGEEYVYRELHEPNLIAAEAARKIVEHTYGEQIYATFAPPDLWARTKESAKTVAELFRENGVDFTQSDNSRINGWQQVKDHIKLLPDLVAEPKDKQSAEDLIYQASPNYKARKAAEAAEFEARKREQEQQHISRLRVFTTCPTLIKHMMLLQYDDKRIGDADTEPHIVTHICVSGDTLIHTVEGDVPISDLVGVCGECYSWDGEKSVIREFDSACMTSESAEVYEVELENGVKIKATANHRVMTAAGWKEVRELTCDDDVLIAPLEN